MSINKSRSILYVNYSPYENAGQILDYILENFTYVYLFTLAFHHLGKNQQTNTVVIYKNKKIIKEISMGYMHVPSRLIFLLIPIRSSINLLQLFWRTQEIVREYGKIDVFFSVNAFIIWGGFILKKLGFIRKTVFWVWDYYPINHENPLIRIMRWFYWQFDKFATKSDKVIFLNQSLIEVRKKAGLSLKSKYPIIPIGTKLGKGRQRFGFKKIKMGFIGVIKKSQGLDVVFDCADMLCKDFPGISLDLIGSGPDVAYFRKRAKESVLPTKFYGRVSEKKIDGILSHCTVGIATYVPDGSNVSYYGDPAKVKKYLGLGLPTIMTNVFESSRELIKEKAGVVINYYKPKELVKAVKKIQLDYLNYRRNARRLNKKYYYKKIYSKMFDFLR